MVCRRLKVESVGRSGGFVSCRRTALPRGHAGAGQRSLGAISVELAARGHLTSEQLVQRALDSMLNSGKGSGVKIRSFLVVRWDRTGARAPLRSIGRNLPMADKEMIAATLAAGVLAAAPPVLDPLAAAKEAASLYFEVLHQLEREAQARKA